jgi:4-hydroxythreonine-4-phosphate dehydrogenase
VVVIGDPDMLSERAATVGSSVDLIEYSPETTASAGTLRVIVQPLEAAAVCGQPDPRNAHSLLDGLRRGVDGCLSGEFSALVTAPLQKRSIIDAGIAFTGHTEYLAELTSTPLPVMLLVSEDMRVALATTHLPLRDVPDAISTDSLTAVIDVLNRDLKLRFGIERPAIVVCGLNPHAGEGGHLGKEDAEIIEPAVAACRDQGIDVRGPLPADTAFTPAAGASDAILAMYHDQGLPVIKYAGFGNAVNVTLGLPIIRTSVDHGTALDLAGKGRADPGSLIAAVRLAALLAQS